MVGVGWIAIPVANVDIFSLISFLKRGMANSLGLRREFFIRLTSSLSDFLSGFELSSVDLGFLVSLKILMLDCELPPDLLPRRGGEYLAKTGYKPYTAISNFYINGYWLVFRFYELLKTGFSYRSWMGEVAFSG